MSTFNYDTYCGIYCGACSIMRAFKSGHKDKFASYWTESTMREFLTAQGYEISETDSFEMKCHGCKSDSLFINCQHCKIRDCAMARKVEHCIDCNEYPCELYKGIVLNKEVQQRLPHFKTAPDNLATINKIGVKPWLEEQEKQWQCPECRTCSSWYMTTCTQCRKDLTEHKDYNNK